MSSNTPNEQQHAYWIDKFAKRGHDCDERTSEMLSAQWKAKGAPSFYYANVMVFEQL